MFVCFAFRTEQGYNETKMRKVFSHLSAIIAPKDIDTTKIEYQEFETAIVQLGYTIDTLMLAVMHPCDKMVIRCGWEQIQIPCVNIFRASRTSEGYCCSFNYKSDVK